MRLRVTYLLLLLVALFVLQCSDSSKPVDPDDPNPPDRTVNELTQSEKDLATSVNTFSFKLFNQVCSNAEPGENVFISPLSVSYALGIAANGAKGQTQSEMLAALEIAGFSLTEANQAYEGLTSILMQADPEVTFTVANSFWSRAGKEIQPQFIKVCQDYFNALVEEIDFQAPDAADRINGWVSDNTNGKITEVIEPPISGDIAALLMNALYFKANWTFPFDPDDTYQDQFYRSDGTEATCDMMYKDTDSDAENYEETFAQRPPAVFNTAVCVGVTLPYGDEGYRMTLLLPNESITADSLVALLNPVTWQEWMQSPRQSGFMLILPKFKFKFDVELKDILISMGMQSAFDAYQADFSNLFVDGNGWIDQVKHMTFVQVDEEGTEAAAVTIVVFIDSASGPVAFNRPFVFVIHEAVSGAVLFMGKIENPTWES